MIDVLYVIGWGRSGSTLLANALGSVPEVVNVGEARALWVRGLGEGDRCGCGEHVRDCPFWTRTLDRLADLRADRGTQPARPDVDVVTRLRERVARTVDTPRIPGSGTPAVDELRQLTGDLARAVSAEAGARVMVDSSKRPSDAALYLGIGDVRLHLIHLVRDPRAVAHSWQRRKVRVDAGTPRPMETYSPLRSSTTWLAWNLLAEWLGRRAASYQRVRYEDLVSRPATVLGDLLESVGVETDPRTVATPDGLVLGTSHTVAGNPDRMTSGAVPVRLDDTWRTEQDAADRRAAALPALPLLSRYGYPRRVSDEPRTVAVS